MKEKIIDLLKDINPYEEFDESTDLLESQFLDSIGVLLLIEKLEDTFGVTIDLDKMQTEYFKNIDSISRYINKLEEAK